MNEHLDVFPTELSELPPDREIEFTIKLKPGVQPISKTPCMMAPAELKESKNQLEELMQQQYIRSSTSP